MITLILCLRPLRVPKFIWFKILHARRYEFGGEMIKNETPDDVLLGAAQDGNLKLAQWAIAQGADDFLEPYVESCSRGFVEISRITEVYSDRAMKMAGRNGHCNVAGIDQNLKSFLNGTCETGQLGAFKKITLQNNISGREFIFPAAKNNQWNIVDYITNSICDVADLLMEGACAGGNYERAVYYQKTYNKDWRDFLYYVCLGGNRDLVDIVLQSGPFKTSVGLIGASNGGHIDIVEKMMQYDDSFIEVAIEGAIINGYTHIVKFLFEAEYGTRAAKFSCGWEMINLLILYEFNERYIAALVADSNETCIMEYLLTLDNDPTSLLEQSCRAGRKKMCQFLISKGARVTTYVQELMKIYNYKFELK